VQMILALSVIRLTVSAKCLRDPDSVQSGRAERIYCCFFGFLLGNASVSGLTGSTFVQYGVRYSSHLYPYPSCHLPAQTDGEYLKRKLIPG